MTGIFYKKKAILTLEEGKVEMMNRGKRGIRVCLLCVVFLAVLAGLFYYYYSIREQNQDRKGTLISHIMQGKILPCQK